MKPLSTPRMMAVLWRQAVLHRRSQGSLWLTWLLVAMLALSCIAPFLSSDPKLLILPATPLFFLSVLWGAVFFGFCRTQYWQRGAGLVPGLRPGIRRIILILSLSLSVLVGGALGILIGYPLLWIGCLLFVFACGTSGGWIAFLVFQLALPKEAIPLILAPAGQVAVLAAALVLWWIAIRRKYPPADATIAAACDSPRLAQKEALAAMARTGLLGILREWSHDMYARDLQRATRSRRNLAIHVIGAAGHWSAAISVLILPGLVVAMIVAFTEVRLVDPYLFVFQALLIGAMWLLGLAQIQQMVQRIAGTVVEQGVLRLAPGIRTGTALSREVVGTMWKRWLVWWFASTAGVMIALGAGFESSERALCTLALLSSSLVMSALLVRDFSKAFKPMELGSSYFIGLLLLSWALLAAFLAFRAYVAPVSWGWMILLNVVAAVAVVRLRWHALAGAPQIFPVRRFA